MENKAYYFTVPEFYFLVMQKRLDGLVFFEEISDYVPNNSDMAYAVASLVQKQVLYPNDDESFRLADAVGKMLEILENAGGVLLEQGRRLETPMQCMYFHQGYALTVQMDELREGYVRLERLPEEKAVRELTEYAFMPDTGECREDESAEIAAVFPFRKETEELLREDSVLLIAERFPRNAQESDLRICVAQQNGEAYLFIGTKDNTETVLYSPERFVKRFTEACHDLG